MSHSDPTTLALAALGEPVSDTDSAHIAACPACRAERDRLRAAARVGRELQPDDEPSAPPPELWRRITEELGDELQPLSDNGQGAAPSSATPHDTPGPVPSAAEASAERPSEDSPSAPPEGSASTSREGSASTPLEGSASTPLEGSASAPLEGGAFTPREVAESTAPKGSASMPASPAIPPRRWSRLRTSLALAASAALIGAAAGIGGTLWATSDDDPPPRVEAEARLEPLPAHQAVGAAYVDTTGGQTGRRLVVRVDGLTPRPGFYEVWLLDRDAKKMIAIGLLPAQGEATFDLPANLDLAGYPVVDVSLQQYNGSPEHSGDSVVRGTLPG